MTNDEKWVKYHDGIREAAKILRVAMKEIEYINGADAGLARQRASAIAELLDVELRAAGAGWVRTVAAAESAKPSKN